MYKYSINPNIKSKKDYSMELELHKLSFDG